mmetsp:Transcript_3071/g.6907  ORF Transcript_3071/g.6907 Transcript_3071/m.6907 type:complete len:342 (-) Transcript_3071:7-1032(-)
MIIRAMHFPIATPEALFSTLALVCLLPELAWAAQQVHLEDDEILQDVRIVWPAAMWQLPISPGASKEGQTAPPDLKEAVATLATWAEEAFADYEQNILPKELAANKQWRTEYDNADASRLNLGFLRWQKQVYSRTHRFDIQQIDWQGTVLPEAPDVSYSWYKWYNSKEYKLLKGRVESVTRQYVASFKAEGGGRLRRLRTFIWAEVYRYGHFQRPGVHTGAFSQGVIFAKHAIGEGGLAQQLVLEDPRGPAPPFGRMKYVNSTDGSLVVLPSWVSHFFTPQPVPDQTNVVLGFVCWPEDGMVDFDWEDDPSGDFVYRRQIKMKRVAKADAAPPPPRDPAEL